MKKLVLSILSARNKTNGKWQLCKDGNMHSMINRLLFMGELNGCTIGLPVYEAIDDLSEWLDIMRRLPCKIHLEFGYPYGKDIHATRAYFNIDEHCLATSIPGLKAKYYMCNTFILADKVQPCDEYVHKDLKSMDFATKIYAYSKEQTRLMPFRHKIEINQNVCHPLYYYAIGNIPKSNMKFTNADLLVPFNLTDKSYDISLLKTWQGVIWFLNPRQSALDYFNFLDEYAGLPPLTKLQYYSIINSVSKVYLPIVEGIFHIVQAELEYFNFKYNAKTHIWSKCTNSL